MFVEICNCVANVVLKEICLKPVGCLFKTFTTELFVLTLFELMCCSELQMSIRLFFYVLKFPNKEGLEGKLCYFSGKNIYTKGDGMFDQFTHIKRQIKKSFKFFIKTILV